MNFDPRITPARPDLAADYLESRVEAAAIKRIGDGGMPVSSVRRL